MGNRGVRPRLTQPPWTQLAGALPHLGPIPWPWELTSAGVLGKNAHTGSLSRGWGTDLEVVSSLLPIFHWLELKGSVWWFQLDLYGLGKQQLYTEGWAHKSLWGWCKIFPKKWAWLGLPTTPNKERPRWKLNQLWYTGFGLEVKKGAKVRNHPWKLS